MATSITTAASPRQPHHPFSSREPGDYNFFLTYIVLIWLAVLGGFIPRLIRHAVSGAAAYPISIHVHAVISVAWMALLTWQTLLIRKREVRLHRKIGIAGAVLAGLVVLVGLWVPLSVESLALGTPKSRPPFIAIELSNIIEFAGLATAAILARKQPSAHKRLILLATLSLTPAAFNRLIGLPLLLPLLGLGLWQTYIQIFAATNLMVLGMGLYDWSTRRQLHPAWFLGALWMFVGQVTACWLYYAPGWKVIATSILRAW